MALLVAWMLQKNMKIMKKTLINRLVGRKAVYRPMGTSLAIECHYMYNWEHPIIDVIG